VSFIWFSFYFVPDRIFNDPHHPEDQESGNPGRGEADVWRRHETGVYQFACRRNSANSGVFYQWVKRGSIENNRPM